MPLTLTSALKQFLSPKRFRDEQGSNGRYSERRVECESISLLLRSATTAATQDSSSPKLPAWMLHDRLRTICRQYPYNFCCKQIERL